MKVQSRLLAAIVTTLSLGISLPAFARPAVLVSAQPSSQINVRSAPSTQSPSPHYGIPGDQVEILRTTFGENDIPWFYVRFPSHATGWVRGDFVRYAREVARYGVLQGRADGRINVYSAPSSRSYSPHYGVPGDVVRLLRHQDDRTGGWEYVRFPSGAEGWVWGELISPMNF
jgi:hypothetical protein